MEQEYGFDQPVSAQYVTYMRNLLHGDLGISYMNPGESVTEVIARALPTTLSLGILAVIVSLVAGTLLGMLQAFSQKGGSHNDSIRYDLRRRNPEFCDRPASCVGFWGTVETASGCRTGFVDKLSASGLITCSLSDGGCDKADVSCMQTGTAKEYVVLAKVKGLSMRRIAWTHVWKNAWIPVLNYAGPAAAFLLTGSFVVESILRSRGWEENLSIRLRTGIIR